jgi:hypothetical protein
VRKLRRDLAVSSVTAAKQKPAAAETSDRQYLDQRKGSSVAGPHSFLGSSAETGRGW